MLLEKGKSKNHPKGRSQDQYVRVILVLLVSILLSVTGCAQEEPRKTVLITQLLDHPAINAVREGVKEELDASGLDYHWVYKNAQGNLSTASQIATSFASRSDADVVIAITTLSAQTVKAAFKGRETPIVFAAVTDPVEAQLVDNLDKPQGFITGTTDRPPIEEQVKLIRQFIPIKQSQELQLGVIYNAGEVNSVKQLGFLRQIAPTYNIRLVERVADSTTKVFEATTSLMDKVDALYLPLDNIVASATPSIISVTLKAKVPVFASDPEGVTQGGIATVGPTHYDEGRAVGRIVLAILRGEKPGDIAVRPADQQHIYFNKQSADKLGLTLPKSLLEGDVSIKYVPSS